MIKYVIILAAGRGERFGGGDVPKQFTQVSGKSILEHSIDACDCGLFDKMVVVVPKQYVDEISARLSRGIHGIPFVVVPGGSTRIESCRQGMDAITEEEAYVVFHNGAQPLVPKESFENCLRGLETSEAVVTSVPCVYTVLKVDKSGHVVDIPDRSMLKNDMGEEGFRVSLLRKIFSARDILEEKTSVVRMVLRSGLAGVLAVDGTAENIKVTYSSDVQDVVNGLAKRIPRR